MLAVLGHVAVAAGARWPGSAYGAVPFSQIEGSGFKALSQLSIQDIAISFVFIGFLEIISESKYCLEQSGNKHYMSGGKPGAFPSLKAVMPHPVPFDLFDPFGLSKNASPEKKAKGLLMEINNGRLAQIGIMGFLAEQKVPGSVPALTGLVKPYSGEIMAPFSASDAGLPFVTDMLKFTLF